MNKCSCKQPERIGVHLPTCDVFVGLTFKDFTEHALYFRDLPADLLEFAIGFQHLLDERPEFYAAAMHAELLYDLQGVFDASQPRATVDAMVDVHKAWFASHFSAERLTALQKNRVIAQEYGFSVSHQSSFKVDANHFFGFYLS